MLSELFEQSWSCAERQGIQQIKSEWKWFFDQTIHIWNDGRVVEIGCWNGGSTKFFSNFARSLTTIDINNPARFNVNDIRDCEFRYFGGNSRAPGTIQEVKRYISSPVQLLFIDGDHSYDGVREDFNNYRDLVCEGGAIAFHDTVISASHHKQNCYVGEFWRELESRDGTNTKSFTSGEDWGGIGIIYI